ncbi:MAG TPA: TIGR04053 family radical SAM/SPASM domain-containing protein [Spirochaetia bacterium]|nr:TIGR04053 family radical SAM/SPASM domain-containing protein [Spirochaetia bacterium]
MQPPWTKSVDYAMKPIFVCWETTKSCLLSCRHCRATAIRSSLPGELDHESGIRLIDQLLEFGEPYPALLLTGGDPLMRRDAFDLMRHAKQRGVYTAVAASVTPLLTREKIELMRDLGVEIMSVSLDGASAQIHDKIRDIPGTFRSTLEAIETAASCGMRLQVNTTVMKSNLRDLADIFNLARERGAVAWEVFFLIRTGRGSSLENPEPGECEEVAHFLFDATQYGIPVRTSEGPHFRRVFIQRQKGAEPPRGELSVHLSARLRELAGEPKSPPSLRLNATGDGKGILFISHDGEVYPSGFLPISLGNVKNGNLKSIYTTHPLLVGMRDPANLKGRCGACEHKVVCSGSRSRAYAEFQDPYQEDPACPYVPSGQKSQSLASVV